MKKVAYRFSLLSLLGMSVAAFFVPSVQAQTLQLGESFELLDTGTLVPQNGWFVEANLSTDPQVVASTSCFAGKCVQFASGASGADVIGRLFTSSDYVSLFYQLRLDGSYTTAFDSIVSYFVSTTSTSFGVLGIERSSNTEFCVEYNSVTSIRCGLNYHENHLVNIVVDMRNYPSCVTTVSVNQNTPVVVGGGSCLADETGEINLRWQGLGSSRTASIDNIIISADPSFVTFGTTTSPFDATNLDDYCGEISTTSPSLIDAIGSSFSNGLCRTFAYFFIPNTDVLNEQALLAEELGTKFPFAWAVDARILFESLATTTSDQFPELTINFGSTTEILGFNEYTVISTSTLSYYLPDSVRTTIKFLIAAIFYLLALAFIYHSVQNIWHKQV